MHLQQAAAVWGSAPAAALLARSDMLPWSQHLGSRAADLTGELIGCTAEALAVELGDAAATRMVALLTGLQHYWSHPYRRRLVEPPVAGRFGAASLLDYGGDGPPLLVVPSLINRAYILDLNEKRSLMRHLVVQGWRPLLLDWGEPGPDERNFDLAAYITGPLSAALDCCLALDPRRPIVLGYCMGGLLALALARLRASDIAALALLATPWDFHAGLDDARVFRTIVALPATVLAGALGALPVDVLQALFAGIDPMQVPRRFVRFASSSPDDPQSAEFVAVEDWLNDGIPLAAPVTRECLIGWYCDNLPARGAWQVAGMAIRPQDVAMPSFVAVPQYDRIVPPGSSAPLAEALPDTVIRPACGHISMVVGARAETYLWAPLTAWLRRNAAMQN